MRGVQLPPIEPGSPEWLKVMSASKIAAVVGLSVWDSRFSLWHRMAGLVEPDEQNEAQARGHFLEDGISRWFAAKHPDFDLTPGTSWQHAEHKWATATPDRDVCRPEGPASLEVKADDSPEWGDDEVPAGYFAQVQWQMMCSGHDTTYVAHLGAFLRFTEYVIKADPEYQAWLLTEAQAFMDSLPDGANPQRPNLDGHTETLMTVRKINPEVGDGDVELDPADSLSYLEAIVAFKEAEAGKREATARVLDVLNANEAKRATAALTVIASKRAGRNGAPAYLQAHPIKTEGRKTA